MSARLAFLGRRNWYVALTASLPYHGLLTLDIFLRRALFPGWCPCLVLLLVPDFRFSCMVTILRGANPRGSLQCGSHDFVLACSVLPGNQPSAAPLVDLGAQTGTSYSWTVNLAAGTLSCLIVVPFSSSLQAPQSDSLSVIAPALLLRPPQSPSKIPVSYLVIILSSLCLIPAACIAMTACIGRPVSTASLPSTTGSATAAPPVTTATGTTPPGTASRPASAAPSSTGCVLYYIFIPLLLSLMLLCRTGAAARTSGSAAAPSASRASASRMEVGFAGILGAAILALFA
jgi:hypothetical protein